MTTTEIATYEGPSLGESIVVFGNLAAQICKTEFVPEAFRNKPEAVLACMLFGKECGLGPMASLNLTQSIKGKVGLKPEGMRAVVQSHGHRLWTETYTDEKVTLCGQRAGDEHVERVSWTMDDAKRADLLANGSWKKYPRAMLLARATSELCRLLFSDVTGGLAYGGDELEEIAGSSTPRAQAPAPRALPADPETGEVIEAKATPARSRRRPPPNTTPAEDDSFGPLVSSGERARLKEQIAALPEQLKVALKQEWVDRKIMPVDNDGFSGEDLAAASVLVDEFEAIARDTQPTLDAS